MEGWLENEARRANRNLLLTNGTMAAVLALVLAANYRYCFNFALGCEPVTAAELAGLKSADGRWRNFVKVTGSESIPTGYQHVVKRIEKSTGRVISTSVKDEYVLLRVGSNLLLVKAPPYTERLEYAGALMPTAEQVRHDLLQPLAAEQPDIAAQILPYTLNAVDYRNRGYFLEVVVLPLFLLGVWNCLKAARRSTEPASAPVWKYAARFGNAEQISQEIESEMQPGAVNHYGKLQLTARWMVRRKLFNLWMAPVGELIWAYKKVTRHSVNFIPTGKTYAIVLVGRRQRREEQMNEKAATDLLQQLAWRVPWALFGFDQNLERAWRKDPQKVIAEVDARYQQYRNRAAGAP